MRFQLYTRTIIFLVLKGFSLVRAKHTSKARDMKLDPMLSGLNGMMEASSEIFCFTSEGILLYHKIDLFFM